MEHEDVCCVPLAWKLTRWSQTRQQSSHKKKRAHKHRPTQWIKILSKIACNEIDILLSLRLIATIFVTKPHTSQIKFHNCGQLSRWMNKNTRKTEAKNPKKKKNYEYEKRAKKIYVYRDFNRPLCIVINGYNALDPNSLRFK